MLKYSISSTKILFRNDLRNQLVGLVKCSNRCAEIHSFLCEPCLNDKSIFYKSRHIVSFLSFLAIVASRTSECNTFFQIIVTSNIILYQKLVLVKNEIKITEDDINIVNGKGNRVYFIKAPGNYSLHFKKIAVLDDFGYLTGEIGVTLQVPLLEGPAGE